MGVETVKQFTFSLVSDLFLSIKDGPQFNSMAHDVELYLGGIMQLPLDFPGTNYHKARLARESLLQTLGPIISQRHKVQDQNFSKSVKQKFFMLTKVT
jgi:cytochrome P450 family 26 subfamily A